MLEIYGWKSAGPGRNPRIKAFRGEKDEEDEIARNDAPWEIYVEVVSSTRDE